MNIIADKFSQDLKVNEGVYVVSHPKFDRPLYVGMTKNFKRRFREHLKVSQNRNKGIFYELALLEIKNKGVWSRIHNKSSYKYEWNREKDITESLIYVYVPKIDFKVVSNDVKTEYEWIRRLNPICNKSEVCI